MIAGGGVAGVEAVMALRALAGGRVSITLVTPETEFVYRAMSVAEPFALGSAQRLPLEQIAHDFDVELIADELDSVATNSECVVTYGLSEIPYDALLLATGARPRPAWDHALTFTGPRDADAMGRLVREVSAGTVESLAFVVPSGVTWPLPLYELALMTARRASEAGRAPELALFTPEKHPLAIFGEEGWKAIASELEAAGVRVRCSTETEVTPDGDVVIPLEETPMRFERVVAVPRLEGKAPRGVPRDDEGFIPIDTHGRVHGVKNLYAAGDGTNFPVKQGGIAAQQADAVAEVIAKRAGAPTDPQPFHGLLRSQLLTGREPRFLRTDLSLRATTHSEASETPLWWPATKIVALHLAPYLAAQAMAAVGAGDSPEPSLEVSEEIRRVVFLPGDFENNPWGE
ncbi:MAG: sulfide:quinone oxidoreductase [Thermoleophilaceae bacterium]|nr:sulfide:quinone oxidoreductase [Thermoleophilaceae bacterium]